MGELKKTFNLTVDLKRRSYIHPFEVVEGDTGNVLVVSVTDDGATASLDDIRVIAVFSSPLGVVYQDSLEGNISISGSIVTIPVNAASISAGPIRCELQFYSGDDYLYLITSTAFGFTCRRALLSEEAITSLPQYPIIIALELLNDELIEAERQRREEFDEIIAALQNQDPRFLHIMYSETNPTSNQDLTTTPSAWMGIYFGTLTTAPEDYSLYTWCYIGKLAVDLELSLESQNAIANRVVAQALLAKQDVISAQTIVLLQSEWASSSAAQYSLTVSCAEASPDKMILVSATRNSFEDYAYYGVYCSSIGDGSLTFLCEKKPNCDLNVEALII